MRNRFSQNLEFVQSIRLFFDYHIFLAINQFQQKQNPHVERTRVDDRLYGCERRDGSVLLSAKEKYRRIANGEGSTDDEDIKHDALAEIFGKEKKNRVRRVGSNTTQMQLEHVAVANVLLNQISASSIVAVHADVAKFTSKFNTDLFGVKSLLMVLIQQGQGNTVTLNGESFKGVGTSRTEVVDSCASTNPFLTPPM